MKIENSYIENNLITKKEHNLFPLVLYNYTQECQFKEKWDNTTLQCRGLILHKETGEIIARPFKKFFNYEEIIANRDKLPNEIPKVYSKFDGSLGILYWYNNEPYIATRGSFDSKQAIWATNFINKPDIINWVNKLDKEYTHLFEIIYPENKIVINYNFNGLIHLASIDKKTGKSIAPDSDFPITTSIPFTSFEELKNLNVKNEEGFVLHYEQSDFRCKIKFDDYIKLHKIITGLSVIGIWEMLKENKNPITEEIPDEMFNWINKIVVDLKNQFTSIEKESISVLKKVKNYKTRKEQAIEIVKYKKISGVVFALLDNNNYKQIIWKMLKPKNIQTFKTEN